MNFLERNGLQTAQAHFKDIFQNNIHRDYADAMLDWLEQETDFFTSPSSTKYHGAHPGGLLVHSLNVYRRLRDIAIRDLTDKEDPGKCRLSEEQEETVAIIALLMMCVRWGATAWKPSGGRTRKLAAGRITRDIHTRTTSPWGMERKACT